MGSAEAEPELKQALSPSAWRNTYDKDLVLPCHHSFSAEQFNYCEYRLHETANPFLKCRYANILVECFPPGLKLNKSLRLRRLDPKHHPYLKYHRENVFEKSKKPACPDAAE